MSEYRLSDDGDYLAHADCCMRDDYAGAIAHLEKTLGRARSNGAIMTASLLLKVIGTIYHFANKRTEAEAAFAAADRESGQSPQIRFFIASFYNEHGEDRDAAIRWLQAIVAWDSTASACATGKSDEDRKYDAYYVKKARDLLTKLTAV